MTDFLIWLDWLEDQGYRTRCLRAALEQPPRWWPGPRRRRRPGRPRRVPERSPALAGWAEGDGDGHGGNGWLDYGDGDGPGWTAATARRGDGDRSGLGDGDEGDAGGGGGLTPDADLVL